MYGIYSLTIMNTYWTFSKEKDQTLIKERKKGHGDREAEREREKSYNNRISVQFSSGEIDPSVYLEMKSGKSS